VRGNRRSRPMVIVGGHHNGQRIICEHDYVILPEYKEVSARIIAPGEIVRNDPVESHCYRVHRLMGNKEQYEVLAPAAMSGDELICRLIEGYNP